MTDLVNLTREYAQDHYYKASWDIVADRWSDDKIADVITGAKTRRGAIAKAWGWLQDIDAARHPRHRPVRPLSAFEFLATNGGLSSDDHLITEVRESIGGNVMVPRRGPLVRQSGKSLDAAREACVEAGYLEDAGEITGGVTQSTINDLLEMIDDEARGCKRYPHGREPYQAPKCQPEQEATHECPF